MSTRVQKGGPIFKPVAKPRPRGSESTSRQPSVALDGRSSIPPSTGLANRHASPEISLISPPMASTSMGPPREHIMPSPLSETLQCSDLTPPPMISVANLADEMITRQPRFASAAPPEILSSISTSYDSQPVANTPLEIPPSRRTRSSKTLSAAPREGRKPRISSAPSFHSDADGEDLDPTSVTMSTLCSDTGQGRISSKAVQVQSNHSIWKTTGRQKRARLKALMEAKKFGRNEENGDAIQDGHPASDSRISEANADGNMPVDPGPSSHSAGAGPLADETGNGFDYSQAMSTSRYSVQVRIGANGETIVDEESLYVDRNAEDETAHYTHVEESDTTKFVNSGTYVKRYRASRWSAEETELFFDALSQFGENYELISYVLPGRDRKSCKNKFKAEDKKNPNRITFCLSNRTPYDVQTLSRLTGKDFSGPTPVIRAPAVKTLQPVVPDAHEQGPAVSICPEAMQHSTFE